ncbi:MAG: hypothetical protein HY817_02695 [Candidatus Abawacabacteria bacterium]|nr:hypothetical protein [Candidatus Abawacabacteria bacterium]
MITQEQSKDLPEQTSALANIDWQRASAIDVRRQLAQAFEKYLLHSMNAGSVAPEQAQDIAGLFVKIFETATTAETLNNAFDILHEDRNPLLRGFSLKVEETRQKAIGRTVYDAMLALAKQEQYAVARELFQLFETGHIQNNAQVAEIVSQSTLHIQVATLIKQLEEAGLKAPSASLQQAWSQKQIITAKELAPWQNLVIGLAQPTISDKKGPVAKVPGINNGALSKLTAGLYGFDKWLRQVVSPNKPNKSN